MADAKHTPGPLHVTREVDSEGYAQHTVRAATGSPVAVLANYSPIEQRGNADLYAAAPELLTQLRDLRKRFHRAILAGGSDEWAADASCAAAGAAIAKATGDVA